MIIQGKGRECGAGLLRECSLREKAAALILKAHFGGESRTRSLGYQVTKVLWQRVMKSAQHRDRRALNSSEMWDIYSGDPEKFPKVALFSGAFEQLVLEMD